MPEPSTATLPEPEEVTPAASNQVDAALNADAIKECLDAGRPIKELLDLGDHVWETMYDFGFRNFQKGQFEAAVYWWVHTCLFDSDRERNWISLGVAYQRQRKYEQALNAFSLAVHHGSKNPWVPMHAAECHLQMKNPTKAASALDCADDWAGDDEHQALLRKRIALLRKGVRKQQNRLPAQKTVTSSVT